MTRKSLSRTQRDKRGAMPQAKPIPVQFFTPTHKRLHLAVLSTLGRKA